MFPPARSGLTRCVVANRRRRRTPDVVAVTVAAWLRVGIAITAAAVGAAPHVLTTRQTALFVLLGLVWVPWTVVVLFAAERSGSQWALLGGPIGDVVALFAVEVLTPSATVAMVAASLVVVAFAAYTVGRAFAGGLAAASITMAVVAQALVPSSARADTGVLVSFAFAALAIVLLLDRTSAVQFRTSADAARLRGTADAVLTHIADSVIVTDADGVVVGCNPASERLLGRPARELVGLPCATALGLRHDDRVLDCSRGCVLLGAGAELGEDVWRGDRERRQPVLASATAVFDDDGRVLEVVHSLRDITRLKEAEEAKTLFLATASHELKTPLTVIRGFVELLRDEIDVDARALALETVHRRTIELGGIIDRLLLSSRIEAGRVELLVTTVAVLPLVEERVIAMASTTGREIRLDVAPDVAGAAGDPAALATVLDHLIENAVKYSPDGGAIEVTVAGGSAVTFTVTDQGIGMDAEQLAHCFEKFWQAESSDVRRFGGTGIGLYIVRSLVNGMGGRVWATSRPGSGTSVHVELAVAASEPPEVERERGEATMIREFMRQIGVPDGSE